jgi:hypothetical protein
MGCTQHRPYGPLTHIYTNSIKSRGLVVGAAVGFDGKIKHLESRGSVVGDVAGVALIHSMHAPA